MNFDNFISGWTFGLIIGMVGLYLNAPWWTLFPATIIGIITILIVFLVGEFK